MNEKVKDILMKCVMNDNVNSAKNTFKRYILVHDQTFFDYKLLMAALERGYIPIVNFLLEQGCRVRNPNKDRFEETALHLAMNLNNSSIVAKILKNGASIYDKNLDRETALFAGFKAGYNKAVSAVLPFIFKDNTDMISSIEKLLDYNTYSTAVDTKGRTPLHMAFYYVEFHEKVQIFDMLISKIPKEVNFIDDQGLSHFHIVCARNDVSQVNDFLKSGVAIDSCVVSGKYSGFTALHFAVLYNHKDVVELLLKSKAQVNIKTSEQLTPLHLACNYFKCSMYFDEYDHMYYAHHSQFRDMIHFIDFNVLCTSDHVNQLFIINLLLLHGADVNAQDCEERTPMFYTCIYDINFPIYCTTCLKDDSWSHNLRFFEMNERLNKIIILTSNNANVNACSKSQESILHIMSKHTFLNEPQLLMEHLIIKGANVDATDNAGLTPLHVAVKSLNDARQVVNVLLKYKANVNVKSKDLKIPIQMLFENSSENLIVTIDIFLKLLENGTDLTLVEENDRSLFKMVNFIQKNCSILLYQAVKDNKNCALERLLSLGANINKKDSCGDICVLPLKEYRLNYISENRCLSFAKTYQIIFIHMKKLQALGHFVSKQVESLCVYLYACYLCHKSLLSRTNNYINLDNIFDNCIEELNRMKLINLNNYTSLYNILVKQDAHELSKLIKNKTLVKTLENIKTENNFPLYSYLLKLQFQKGLMRSYILESANGSLSSVSGLNLPDPCCDSVLKYLTDEDILNLKAAVNVKDNL